MHQLSTHITNHKYCKIIEKLVHKPLCRFLDQNEILYNNQYVFRINHSATHALTDITDKVKSALDNNKHYPSGVFIDQEKASVTVNHTILLAKLKYCGVRGITNHWFKSFLQDRYQYINIKECSSDVPQGSIPGLLLFLLYINDLSNAMMHCSVHHFAGDTNHFLTEITLES